MAPPRTPNGDARRAAALAGETLFSGAPCPGCSGTTRYTKSGKCRSCNASKVAETNRRKPMASRRDSRLRTRFALPPGAFDTMMAAQSGRCAICVASLTLGTGRHAVDHCHTTGRVRALLCQACNTGIGKLGDNPDRLRAAADYLEHHRTADEPSKDPH